MKMRTQRMDILRTGLGLLLLCGIAAGEEPAAVDSKPVFEDSFNRSELGDRWHIVTPSFSIRDGRLLGHEEPARHHVAVCRVRLPFRNGVFEFSLRLTDGENVNFVINDQNCEQAHAGHICRVSFTPTQVRISDDREGAFRKDWYEQYLKSGRTLDRREQLDGREKFIAYPIDSAQWYRVRIVLTDDEIAVTMNDRSIGSFRSPGIAHPTKTDFGFAVKGNALEIDDLRVFDADSK